VPNPSRAISTWCGLGALLLAGVLGLWVSRSAIVACLSVCEKAGADSCDEVFDPDFWDWSEADCKGSAKLIALSSGKVIAHLGSLSMSVFHSFSS